MNILASNNCIYKPVHAKLAHVAERHRRAGWLLLLSHVCRQRPFHMRERKRNFVLHPCCIQNLVKVGEA